MDTKYQPKKYQLSGIADLLVISHTPTWFGKISIRFQGLLVYEGINYEEFNCTLTKIAKWATAAHLRVIQLEFEM